MFKSKISKRVVAQMLAVVMVISGLVCAASPGLAYAASLGTPESAKYKPIQLKAASTKEMDYYDTQTPDGIKWVTDATELTFMPSAAIGDVTCAVKDGDSVYWVGTNKGLMRINFKEADQRDIVQYFAGSRYLYGGDDNVTGVASDNEGGVWVRNAKGAVHIRMPKKTMLERTYVYEKLINDVNDRRGMISTNNGYTYDPTMDEYYSKYVSTSDNDGLWTAMYAMGEIFRYRTLKAEKADAEEIAAAKAAATRATKAVLLLDYISGRGNGFPCRSYMLKSEAAVDSNTNLQNENGFWFEKRLLNEGETYPDPIIDEMKLDGKTPIGIATVRITKDALSKKGSQVLASSDLYNGLGLSPSAIETFNAERTNDNLLGKNIVSSKGLVYPVMVEGANIGREYENGPIDLNKIKFRLTTPIYERIPTFFNDLFPESVIGSDGYIDESQIVYKADTSSDEVDGHYALFLTAYRYLCDTPEDNTLKNTIVEAATKMTDLILEDDHYYIVDAHGKSTQWSRWLSEYFNDGIDMMKAQPQWKQYGIGVDAKGEDHLSYGFEDGPLNALEVMMALKTTSYIAKDSDAAAYADQIAKYEKAYDLCYESPYSGGGANNDKGYVNGKGYIDMANEYIDRRLVRQATDAYDNDNNTPVIQYDEKLNGDKTTNAVLHNDWTQYINYSDEELGWFPVYALLTLETNADRKNEIVSAFDQWYVGQEEREENPFYTFLYQLAHPDKTDVDLASAVRYFYRSPQIRNQTLGVRGDRQDVFYIEPCDRDKEVSQTNYALAPDERAITKNNSNPFTAYSGFGEQTKGSYTEGSMGCGTVFTLPYWFGRYYGMIAEENKGDYYDKKTPSALLRSDSTDGMIELRLYVTDDEIPLPRVITDFYADGKYIGRARTDNDGIAHLTIKATQDGNYSAVTTERLIGKTMYRMTKSTTK